MSDEIVEKHEAFFVLYRDGTWEGPFDSWVIAEKFAAERAGHVVAGQWFSRTEKQSDL